MAYLAPLPGKKRVDGAEKFIDQRAGDPVPDQRRSLARPHGHELSDSAVGGRRTEASGEPVLHRKRGDSIRVFEVAREAVRGAAGESAAQRLGQDRVAGVLAADGARCTGAAADSSVARNAVPIWTACAPRLIAAAKPRPSAIPPAAMIGTETRP